MVGFACFALAAIVAVGAGAVSLRSAASDANDRADAAEVALRQADDEAAGALRDAQSASAELAARDQMVLEQTAELDRLGQAFSTVETDLESAQSELSETQDSFITPAELAVHRDDIAGMWDTMGSAMSTGDLDAIFATIDRDMNELVGWNVADEHRECKETLVNYGYASAIIVASSLYGSFDVDTSFVIEIQTEIKETTGLRAAIVADACDLA